jgi:hypothetical protein
MSIPRRLRFEVLRRDGYTCRYCGARAPEVPLTVDHVIPEALGGATEANNLVTACQPCNAGKASTAPDSPLVEDVDAAALLFARAMEQVAEVRRRQLAERDELLEWFDRRWQDWNCEGEPLPRPSGWRASVERFLVAGLAPVDLDRLLVVTMDSKVYNDGLFRYFCGCCWNEISERQELARRLIEDDGLE